MPHDPVSMQDDDIEALRAGIATLEGQRVQLGDMVVDLALAPLRARLASLLRPAGLRHRQITVLFADVVGSTALADGLPAEDTLAILNAAMQRMADIVQACQGRVLRFTGDGVKAAFGMDEVREDDAGRAVRAGLAICQAGREQAEAVLRQHGVTGFAVRVGVHTGDVALGTGIDADNTAMGAAVNVAARMEQSAPPGGLRISHDTWSQVRGLFEVEPQPPLPVKGIAAPMNTYLVRAALDRSVASVERGLQGLSTPLVGRQAELQRMLDAVTRARETGQLQALTLLGDAGLGKSRLLREFTAALMAKTADCRVLTLRAQPDGLLRLFGLLRALLAAQCGMTDTDSAEVARRKVVEGLVPLFEERGERQAQLIGHLAGLDFADSIHVKGLDPRGLRDQAFAAIRGYLQALAAQRALPVLLVEDLHWADDGSLDLLLHLLAHAAELPLALVMTSRPALLARRPDWATPDTMMQLDPLGAAQSDELAQALLQRLDEVPQRLNALIAGLAEGNPYYMEELVRRLVDDGIIDVAGPRWTVLADRLNRVQLPTTLVGLLQARLDALPAGERHAARQASIVGHVFWDDALQALDERAPQALPALQRAAFVKAHDRSDFEGTPERQFDHHLLHQVTYDTLLKSERKQGHAAAARWLAERTRSGGAELLAMTGEHAERAGDIALAVDCFERAGREAQKRYALTMAQAWLRRALDLLGDTAAHRRVRILLALDSITDTQADRQAQDALLSEAAALIAQHPDDALQGQCLLRRAMLLDRCGDEMSSEPIAQQAFEVGARCGDAVTAARASAHLAWVRCVREDLGTARMLSDRSLDWAARIKEEQLRDETAAPLRTLSAMVSMLGGRLSEARAMLLDTLALGERLGSPKVQIGALDNLAEVAIRLGHWRQALEWIDRSLAVAGSIGALGSLQGPQMRAAVAHDELGNHAEALRWGELALISTRRAGDIRREAKLVHDIGDYHRNLGNPAAAADWYGQAQTAAAALGDAFSVVEAMACRAQCLQRMGQHDEARTLVDEVLAQMPAATAGAPKSTTLEMRRACHEILQAQGDDRAPGLLLALAEDVQASVAELGESDDHERITQAFRNFREITAATVPSRQAP